MKTVSIPENEALDIIARCGDERIAKQIYNGETIWIKNYSHYKKGVFYYLQKFISALIPFRFLKPTTSPSGQQAVQIEKERVDLFLLNDVLCPGILFFNDTHIIFSDAGESLDALIRNGEQKNVMERAAHALADLHNKGLYHGRPFLRDMVQKGDRIGFIDFEEDALKIMPLKDAQARDIWVFSLNLVKYCKHDCGAHCSYLRLYFDYLDDKNYASIKQILSVLSPVIKFSKFVRANRWGKDIHRAIVGTEALKTVIEKLK